VFILPVLKSLARGKYIIYRPINAFFDGSKSPVDGFIVGIHIFISKTSFK